MDDTKPAKELKFIEPTVEDMVTKLSFGQAVALGQMCPECLTEHYCDALCFRFPPKLFKCQGCGQFQRHRKMEELQRSYQMNRLLDNTA